MSQEIGKPLAERPVSATDIGIKELLEAGVHFGHQTRRWNPKMRRFIFGERGGIHIIDLQKTERLLHVAQEFAAELAGRGGTVLFVGTKKQARDGIKDGAERCNMPYVNQRWLGGLLTNFQTISKRIRRLHELRDWTESGTMDLLPVREPRREVHRAEVGAPPRTSCASQRLRDARLRRQPHQARSADRTDHVHVDARIVASAAIGHSHGRGRRRLVATQEARSGHHREHSGEDPNHHGRTRVLRHRANVRVTALRVGDGCD